MSAHQQIRTQAAPTPLATKAAPSGMLQRKCACGTHTVAGGECDSCQKKHEGTLQRTAAGGSVRVVPPVVGEVLSSAGRPLDAGARSFMESRFGHDFSRVRVHTDSRAAESARAVGAFAYTVGEDIVFAHGRYSPGTEAGRRLLAHEMTHVLQQRQSAAADLQEMQIDGGPGDRYEAEADAVAERVMSGAQAGAPSPLVFNVARTAQRKLMRANDACLSKCEEIFNDCVKRSDTAYGCIASRSVCTRQCEPEKPPEEKPPEKEKPAPKDDGPKVCDPPKGPGKHPKDGASQKLIDRMLGKYATKDGDPGEGCAVKPYVASRGEHVCTLGFGQQLPDCPVLSANTKKPPTQEEIDDKSVQLICECADTVQTNCTAAEGKLKQQASSMSNHVKKVLPVETNQAQFDAFVDISMHVGHFPEELLEAVKKYWCTDEGKDKVREIYLKTALTAPKSKKIEPGFVNRRKHRVWPPSTELVAETKKK